ncbi:MAG: biopolymer transporter ExbD [Ferruginibacter sp.]
MAENISSEKIRRPGQSSKKSTRVDLTPMVDLGFLLITFFVFTSALSIPTAMKIITPNDKDSSVNDPICESCAITLIPSANDKLYYYEGSGKDAVYLTTDYSPSGLRALLMRKKIEAAALGRDAVLIIKPDNSSVFKNVINIIDESNIVMYKKYYLDETH